jgi:hypothetical protein
MYLDVTENQVPPKCVWIGIELLASLEGQIVPITYWLEKKIVPITLAIIHSLNERSKPT